MSFSQDEDTLLSLRGVGYFKSQMNYFTVSVVFIHLRVSTSTVGNTSLQMPIACFDLSESIGLVLSRGLVKVNHNEKMKSCLQSRDKVKTDL